MKEATSSADPGDLYVYAGMYSQGITVPVDKEKAVRLYRMSAEKGCTEAQVRLGAIYMTGDGAERVSQNPSDGSSSPPTKGTSATSTS